MNEREIENNKDGCKSQNYSYRDMMDAWTEGRLNLVKWGCGDGDKPDFASWMRQKFSDKSTGMLHACLPPNKKEIKEIYDILDTIPYFRSENESVSIIMKHFKGHCNPQMVREIINEYIKENFTDGI